MTEVIITGFEEINYEPPIVPVAVEAMAKAVADIFSGTWTAHAKEYQVSPNSKPWWTLDCENALASYRLLRTDENWWNFKQTVKSAKRAFFDDRISKIANSNKRPWDLMDWVKEHKNPPCEAIQFNGAPCHDMPSLWEALHSTYNSASDREVDLSVVEEVGAAPVREWLSFQVSEL